ncbi:uncharacterized protein CMU_012790 [Cryptosporidium muris RN66]|uniref:Transmembrane protein n=1 Tax=Cryptosporidium muris (strain RN66) TaxID=441375 RepID=B6AEI8_CRYMR|nr:uncharacterized protein CMU_012790 [Cryptosporidium muris RN66]EEA06605.1 hypothetical protein CMU_012790 [Cryptosporidium muris RN66]|eukprot:XP_002140954.1 hypothetical protein [Cryptosporidium muris RN66]
MLSIGVCISVYKLAYLKVSSNELLNNLRIAKSYYPQKSQYPLEVSKSSILKKYFISTNTNSLNRPKWRNVLSADRKEFNSKKHNHLKIGKNYKIGERSLFDKSYEPLFQTKLETKVYLSKSEIIKLFLYPLATIVSVLWIFWYIIKYWCNIKDFDQFLRTTKWLLKKKPIPKEFNTIQ